MAEYFVPAFTGRLQAMTDSWNCVHITNVANDYKDIYDVFKCLSTVKGIAEEEERLKTFTQLPRTNILNNTLLKKARPGGTN